MAKITTVEEAIAAVKAMESEMQEKLKAVSEFSNDELIGLLGLVRFDENSSFNDVRFSNKVIMESLRRLLINAKSPNDES